MEPDGDDPHPGLEEWTARRRAELILSILRGEASAEEAIQRFALTPAALHDWRNRFLAGGENALRSFSSGSTATREFRGTSRFRLLEKIGEGGMGLVYRAYDERRRAPVALKMLSGFRETSERIRRLKEEFRTLQGVLHPNLVELYDLVANASECFFTMELLDGVNLAEHVRSGLPAIIDTSTAGLDEPDAPPTSQMGPPLPAERLGVLESALEQLVEGVCALHAVGKLHRDIKPSNLQVTSAGRLVLLDFGLATELAADAEASLPGSVGGTHAYASPEQLRGEPLSFASDWYAVGVLLYQLLTGRMPFRGAYAEVLRFKEQGRALPLRGIAPDIPHRLETLVFHLLDPLPRHRAGPADILKAIGRAARRVPPRTWPLVGRHEQMAGLWRALENARQGQVSVALLEGSSGFGKTELARRFVSQVESSQSATVLSGRCLPEELVAYRALDGVVDRLATHLAGLPADQRPVLELAQIRHLLRLFAALQDPLIPGGLPEAPHESLLEVQEPRELRKLGFDAFRELLIRSAKDRCLLVWVDDLQWIDRDSEPLLAHLLQPQSASILFLLSYRTEDAITHPFLSALRERRVTPIESSRISVDPLSDTASRELLGHLLAGTGLLNEQLLGAMVVESSGSPFLLGELSRYATQSVPLDQCIPKLANLMGQRIGGLTDSARTLVELAAVAGRPIGTEQLRGAAGLDESIHSELSRLAHGRILRLIDHYPGTSIEMYHDKIREAVLAQLTPELRRLRHGQLANELAHASGIDDEVLALHFFGSGEHELAAGYAMRAAESARAKLAFDREAALHEQVIESTTDASRLRLLHEHAACAWANAGQSARAAWHFERAGELTGGGEAATKSTQLLRLAGEHYLRSGRLSDGMRLFRLATAETKVRIPATRLGALISVLPRRAGLLQTALRRPVQRDIASEAPAFETLDVLWSASTSISMMNHVAADAVGVRFLRGALATGERSRIIRGLGYEAAFETVIGFPFLRRNAERLLQRMEADIAQSTIPYDRAWGTMSQGIVAWFNADWERAIALCDQAAAIYRSRCRGTAWELAITDAYALPALAYLGDLQELQRRVPRALAAAKERGDLFNANTCRMGLPNLVWLLVDRPEQAASEADAALSSLFGNIDVAAEATMGPLRPSLFLTPHYHHAFALTQVELYRGDAWAALRRIEAIWPSLRRAFFLRARVVRSELQHLRGRACLAAARARLNGQVGHRSGAKLLRSVKACVRALERDDLDMARGFAHALRAGTAQVCGDASEVREQLSAAASFFERGKMALYALATRSWESPNVGSDGFGAERLQEIASLGAKNPRSMLRLLLPGLAS